MARRRSSRWRSAQEATIALTGDELIEGPDVTATRAITVRASAADVWPWISQLGQGRGGFYSYDWLEDLVGCDIHSADRILPDDQHVRVGSAVRLHPELALAAVIVIPGRALVLRGGVPLGGAPAPYDFTWAFVLVAQPDGTTRLVVRERYRYLTRWAALIVRPVQPVSLVMSRRMLRGIRDRAEGRATFRRRRGRPLPPAGPTPPHDGPPPLRPGRPGRGPVRGVPLRSRRSP